MVKLCLIGAVLVTLWVLPDWSSHRRRAQRLALRLHLGEPPPPTPSGRPIEQIAADVRRIQSQVRHVPPGTPAARRRGWLEAYDDVLVAACAALDLEERIRDLPEGPQRDLERERVERLLTRAGLRLCA